MKKYINLTLVLIFSMIIVSCSKDDDSSENNTFSNTAEYNGTTYEISRGSIENYGSDGSHYNYYFELFGTTPVNTEFYLDLYSRGVDNFRSGTFVFVPENTSTADLPEFYFDYSSFVFGNEQLEVLNVKEGSITVRDEGDNNFSLFGELILENDEVLKISYSGEFSIEVES